MADYWETHTKNTNSEKKVPLSKAKQEKNTRSEKKHLLFVCNIEKCIAFENIGIN